MRTNYTVTITDTVMNRFNPRRQCRSILENITIDPNEATQAHNLLETAPIGAQLHAHFQGKQLVYKNAETNETITFKNTYVKFAEGRIAAKPIRNSLLAAGSYGQAKLLVDIQTGNHIVAKELFTGDTQFQTQRRSELLSSYFTEINNTQNLTLSFNGQVSSGIVLKARNPFKQICKTKNAQAHNISYGNITFLFRMTPEQKKEAKKTKDEKTQNLLTAINDGKKRGREQKNDMDTCKPIIYSEYRGYDLLEFLRNRAFLTTDIAQLPRVAQESLHILHHAIHQKNLLHCDLKLENLLLLRDKTGKLSPFICDPDFAIQTDPETKIGYSKLKGTPQYLPPEFFQFFDETMARCLLPNNKGIELQASLKNFKETLFPPRTNLDDRNNAPYSTKTDIYSMGMTWNVFLIEIDRYLRHSNTQLNPATQQRHTDLKNLVKLMTHHHPLARPSLVLMQLAILPLAYNTLSEETLPGILEQQHLPNISLKNLHCLSGCMIQIANCFRPEDPNPFHLLKWLYNHLQTLLIAHEIVEHDITTFTQFICFLHRNDPIHYYSFDKRKENLGRFLNRSNNHYDMIATLFFNHADIFKIAMDYNLLLRWNHVILCTNAEITNYFTTVLQYFDIAHQTNNQGDQPENFISQKLIIQTKEFIANTRTDLNILYNLSLKITHSMSVLSLLKQGKSIWEIILTEVQTETFDEMKIALLFEWTTHFHQAEPILFLRKNLLTIAININDIDKLAFITDHILFYKQGGRSTHSSGFFQSTSQHIHELYQFYYYCALINCIQLTATMTAHPDDVELQSDISKLTAFLNTIKDNPDQQITLQTSELRVEAILDEINRSATLNIHEAKQPSSILKRASTALSLNLHERHQNNVRKQTATPTL